MVKDHTKIMRGNLLPPHGLLPKKQQGIFYLHVPIERTVHTTALDTPTKPMGPPKKFDPTTQPPQASALPTELHPAPYSQ